MDWVLSVDGTVLGATSDFNALKIYGEIKALDMRWAARRWFTIFIFHISYVMNDVMNYSCGCQAAMLLTKNIWSSQSNALIISVILFTVRSEELFYYQVNEWRRQHAVKHMNESMDVC